MVSSEVWGMPHLAPILVAYVVAIAMVSSEVWGMPHFVALMLYPCKNNCNGIF